MHSNKSCFSINVNGLVIHDDEGTVVSNKTLEKDIVLKVLETCRKRGYPSVVYSGHHIITSEDNPLAQCLPSYHVCQNILSIIVCERLQHQMMPK